MFRYKWQSSKGLLSVELPDKIDFNFSFLNATTRLLFLIEKFPCKTVRFSCKDSAKYDKLSKAYLFNLFRYIARKKTTQWNMVLRSKIISTIHSKKGENFSPIDDIAERATSPDLNFYGFKGDVGIDKPIKELSKLMVDKNVSIDPERVKEFLSTTIGEIFSNSINHSDQEELFFMFDIVWNHDTKVFLLYVNIIDYGKTIVENVNSYFQSCHCKTQTGKDCIAWAIQSGNTTRQGSGGYGLPTLIEYIKEVHGDLFIFSGNAYYRLERDAVEISENSDGIFRGTSVTFKVELFDTSRALRYDPQQDKICSISLDSI